MIGLPPAPRGIPQIEITFDIDANGILNVSAKDKATGKEQNIRIEASSGLSKEEIERMKQEAEANADADKKAKEEADALNSADALAFSTEKLLKEHGDKIEASEKEQLETELSSLRESLNTRDIVQINEKAKTLSNTVAMITTKMYQQNSTGSENVGDMFGNDPFKGPTA
jgi:molecular chaperone DnaK